MCINFLKMHSETKSNENVNLDVLLLDFLELYGQKFDYENTGISIENGGNPLPRNKMPCGLVDGQYRLFCVIDAVNPGLNACSVTYRAPDVKKAFNEAYMTLSMAIQNKTNEQHSVLGRIIYVTNDFLEYRKWVRENF